VKMQRFTIKLTAHRDPRASKVELSSARYILAEIINTFIYKFNAKIR